MKRIAVKGLSIMAVVICVSIFFSGTIRTITTAKVQLVPAKQGRIEELVKLEGILVFPETNEINVDGIENEVKLIIRDVFVDEGKWVEKGELLFTAYVSEYEKIYASYEADYKKAQKEEIILQQRYSSLRFSHSESMWIQAYDSFIDAKMELQAAKSDFEVAVQIENIELVDGKLPTEVENEEIITCWKRFNKALEREEAAEEAFNSANRLGIREEVIDYIEELRKIESEMKSSYDSMRMLKMLAHSASAVYAPHSGYVVKVNVVEGQEFDGNGAAIVLSADEAMGVLRIDVNDLEREIEKLTDVEVGSERGKIRTTVTCNGIAENGSWYLDVGVTQREISMLGGAAKLMNTPTDVTFRYRADSSTTLLPISAVRGSGENRYIYLVSEKRNTLGNTILRVNKMDVHVIVESEDMVSIQENLGRQSVAYMEDRPILDGSEVMEYAK